MQKTYRVHEVRMIDGEETPVSVWVDDLRGQRVEMEHGTTFTAELEKEKVWDRRFRHQPVEVETGRWLVKSADIDVLPGCLDSLIRTGRAVDVEALPKAAPAKPAKKAKKKR